MNIDQYVFKNTCNKWLNKKNGDIIFLGKEIVFDANNPDWVLIPNDAQFATYSDNKVRSDVLMFWKLDGERWYCLNQQSKEWFKNGNTLKSFLTEGTYQGKIIWSLWK